MARNTWRVVRGSFAGITSALALVLVRIVGVAKVLTAAARLATKHVSDASHNSSGQSMLLLLLLVRLSRRLAAVVVLRLL